MTARNITIIGGGLAGCEAAWQCARRGLAVDLYEMKPVRYSAAHSSPALAELVCSNSLRAADVTAAVGLLKEEMRRLGSLIIAVADLTQVPAGRALAVDRELFAAEITRRIEDHPLITIHRQEITELPPPSETPIIIASGPLTSEKLSRALIAQTGRDHFAFYDAIAPIVTEESLDRSIIYQASRYDDGPGDYLNCPMDKEQYFTFIREMAGARKVALKDFEKAAYFEGCLPVEVMLERGDNTLRFGPMKPVGLTDPRTGRWPYAVVQLRRENQAGTTYNMVGFQTKLAYAEQKRVFRLIPGMAQADFVRLGSIHRNSFVCAPAVLNADLSLKGRPDIRLAGQITGVEGYVESTAMGLLAGLYTAAGCRGEALPPPPPDTAHGALISHLTTTEPAHFQPSNVNFGLFPALPTEISTASKKPKKMPKKMRGALRSEQALISLSTWATGIPAPV